MGTKKRVLLVGSSTALAYSSETAEWRSTVEVRTAGAGGEALALHRAEKADILVADLDLPDGPAEQLCDTIRQDEALRRVALLVLCGTDEAERRRAADCRANAHIVRPSNLGALGDEITRLLSIPKRAMYRVLAHLTVAEQEEGYSFFCTSENVSANGILVETEEPLRLGQTLDCSFFLPGRQRVATQGKVVRAACSDKGRQFGIRFVGIPERDAQVLGNFVETWGKLR
jgi:DNA-binding response OmpR family regulator